MHRSLLIIVFLFSACDASVPIGEVVVKTTPDYSTKCDNKMLMQKDGNGFWFYPRTIEGKAWTPC